jgi:myo-inositol catabolism protein IolC
MSLGYNRPLYLLPFDHRNSYVTGMFNFTPPLTAGERKAVVDSKWVIYDGFRQAVGTDVAIPSGAILVDEEFGADILLDAVKSGYLTALSTEKSGSDEFEFEYGAAFPEHIEAFGPTFAKALVRYNPAGDAALNRRQTVRLKQLSDYCRSARKLFMFELLVPATKAQMDRVHADKRTYDLEIRPELMFQAIRTLQDDGVEPDVWKIEGLDRREDCERIVAAARRGGRDHVGCIILGRGEDEKKVREWLTTAARVPGFIGFAVGRTDFWEPLVGWRAKKTTREDAAADIAGRYRGFVDVFEKARAA